MKQRPDSQQLTMEWMATVEAPPAKIAAAPPVEITAAVPSVSPATEDNANAAARLVQTLPWDFCTTFPPVMEDAIEAGILHEEDALPVNLASLHEEQINTCLAALTDLEVIHDARRRGVDPKTGKKPRNQSKQRELHDSLSQEIMRIEHWQHTLLETYEGAFGTEAARAFDKYIRARHAGVPVVASSAPPHPPAPCELPVGKPRPSAVAAGVFGQDENGPVDPSDDEILDITQNHAQSVIELIEYWRDRTPSSTDQSTLEVREAVKQYAADFGHAAADKLLAYCRRQVALNGSGHWPVHRPR